MILGEGGCHLYTLRVQSRLIILMKMAINKYIKNDFLELGYPFSFNSIINEKIKRGVL